jgi:electron-transferring-flavoprotein dehydrogenase
LSHTTGDTDSTQECSNYSKDERVYPAPDGVLTFDMLTNLQQRGTYHEDDQPSHLRIKPELQDVPKSVLLHGGPEQRFCPAGVYEYVDNTNITKDGDDDGPDKKLVINAQVRPGW